MLLLVVIACSVFYYAAAFIDSFDALSPVPPADYSLLEIDELPTIHATAEMKFGSMGAIVFVNNCPTKYLLENRLEISLWMYINSGKYEMTVFPNYALLNLTENILLINDGETRHTATVISSFPLTSREEDVKIRLVLRLLRNSTHSLDAPPTPECRLRSFCTDVIIPGVHAYNWTGTVESFDKDLQARYGVRAEYLVSHVKQSLANALAGKSKLNDAILKHKGLSGPKFRHFMNNLGAMPDARYLELGVYYGSTLFSALFRNGLKSVAIDNWNDPSLSTDSIVKQTVMDALATYRGENDVDIIDGDCWEIADMQTDRILSSLQGKANIYFYDAGHEALEHFMALTNYIHVVDDVFILIVDDWNMDVVKDGTYMALISLGLDVIFRFEVTSSGLPDDILEPSEWFDGTAVFVVGKRKTRLEDVVPP